MSDEPNAEPPTKPKRRLRDRVIPRTTAGKATAVTALVLTITLAVVWSVRAFGPDSVRWMHAMTWPRMLTEFSLVVCIPIAVYWTLRRWHRAIEGEYPDIDHAWEAGMRALAEQGVDPADYPIFLVLGSADQAVEQGLMRALETELPIAGIPDASGVRHALQWYWTEDGIYLFCPTASSLSALMGRWTRPTGQSRIRRPAVQQAEQAATPAATPSPPPASEHAIGDPKKLLASTAAVATSGAAIASAVEPARAAAASIPSGSSDAFLGTIQFPGGDSGAAAAAGITAAAAAVPAAKQITNPLAASPQPSVTAAAGNDPASAGSHAMRPAPTIQGTIALDQWIQSEAPSTASPTPQPAPTTGPPHPKPAAIAERPRERIGAADTAASAKQIALPGNLDTSDQIPRLRYVCKLLKRVRRPHCGINGLVTLIPFDLSRVGTLQLSAIAQSARGDVSTVQETLGVRVPVTALLIGLEQDKGFTELTRRLQPGLLSRRLGGRFDLRSRPTPAELNIHSDRLCDAFEDWVYRLFGFDDAIARQRGNRKLFALISRIRHELKPRLRIVLGHAFGCDADPKDASSQDAFFFSGCYFAASGAETGRPAFVKGVLRDKLIDEQSQVEWTHGAVRGGRWIRLLVVVGWLIALVLTTLVMVEVFTG